jgi:sigma-B regulation protein RsbU (phosphoserine phosphatase)
MSADTLSADSEISRSTKTLRLFSNSVLASAIGGTMSLALNKRTAARAVAPVPTPAQVPELHDAQLAAVYYGQRLGGDFYDFTRVSSTRVVFGLLDVAGRVDESRGILCDAQQVLRTRACELLADDDVNEAEAMVTLALELNRTVLKGAKGARPCPAFAGCYNEALGLVCYFNAGHTPGLVRDGGGVTELPASGLPLGLFSHSTWDAPMVALAPGARLLLVSRGLVEGKRKGEEFGLDRLKTSFQASTAESAKEVCLSAIDSIKQFMGTAPTHNDVTALSLVRDTFSE